MIARVWRLIGCKDLDKRLVCKFNVEEHIILLTFFVNSTRAESRAKASRFYMYISMPLLFFMGMGNVLWLVANGQRVAEWGVMVTRTSDDTAPARLRGVHARPPLARPARGLISYHGNAPPRPAAPCRSILALAAVACRAAPRRSQSRAGRLLPVPFVWHCSDQSWRRSIVWRAAPCPVRHIGLPGTASRECEVHLMSRARIILYRHDLQTTSRINKHSR